MEKIIVVCGPTATGKSDYAVELAKKVGGEVVSADSRQIYKGLDIGSGKITKREMKGVPHHLLDVANPKRVFSVTQYKKLADKAIKDILSRGKTPIIAGGTGFYIDAIICDIVFPAVPPNKTLRKELEKLSLEKLQEKLENLDPRRFNLVDQKNKVRLIRAIEIATVLGSVPELKKTNSYDVEWICLDFSDDILKERIHIRLFARIRGIVTEVKRLHTEGVSWKRLESLGLEYKYMALYLQKKISREEMVSGIEKDSWQYAKRQRTWFKKYAK
ncbi:MAG: tRNA (adenosine(37)-N6)-dimethylallyltransferase MiaA [Candidatus Pacebacteria bacterium]|nr:tRNA (adenosine(37)-N6)-dimethylallyltransferase MiaA [Candidatus Paceibacterota bacterium]